MKFNSGDIFKILGLIPDQWKLVALILFLMFGTVALIVKALPNIPEDLRRQVVSAIVKFVLPFFALICISATAYALTTGNQSISELKQGVRKLEGTHTSQIKAHAPLPPEAITELATLLVIRSRSLDPPPGIDAAIARLKAGDASAALKVLKADNTRTAESLRSIGLLSFYTNARASLASYEKSVELDPDSWIAWYQIALLRERLQIPTAANAAEQVLHLAGKEGAGNEAAGAAYAALAIIARDHGRFEDAVQAFQKAQAYYRLADRDAGYAGVTAGLARTYYSDGHLQDAYRYYTDALNIDRGRFPRGETADYIGLGDVASAQGKYDDAIHFYGQALEISEKTSNLYEMALALSGRRTAYLRRGSDGDLQLAQADGEKALAYDRQAQNAQGMVYDMMGLAAIARVQRNYKAANNLYEQAWAAATGTDNTFLQATVKRGLGQSQFGDRDFPAALDAFQKAHQLDVALKRTRYAALDQYWIGEVYAALSQHDAACSAWKKAKQSFASKNPEELSLYLTGADKRLTEAHCAP